MTSIARRIGRRRGDPLLGGELGTRMEYERSKTGARDGPRPWQGVRLLDIRYLEQIRALDEEGDDRTLSHVVAVYIRHAPRQMGELLEAAAARDLPRLVRYAHTLKSSSANLGGLALSRLCAYIEETARSGDFPQSGILDEARHLYQAFEACLRVECPGAFDEADDFTD